MTGVKLNLDVVNSSQFHNMGIELWIDQNKFFDNFIAPGRHHVVHEFQCADGDHCLQIVLKGKTAENTRIDANGNILDDAMIDIENLCLDQINIDSLCHTLALYEHDHNGTQSLGIYKFYGHLGCNGHVQMKFSSPVYLWMLENL